MISRLGVALGVAGLCVSLLAGQEAAPPAAQPAPEQPTFRTAVKLVRVDVTVTGRGDEPAIGLGPGDFEVEEDGTPQVIESFQLVRLDGRPTPGDDMSLDIRSPEHADAEAARDDVRLFAVFLDDYHLPQYALNNVELRRALTRFIEKEIQPTDLVAVMDPITPISSLKWTRSKPDLLARVRNYEGLEGNYTKARSILEEGQLLARDVRRVRAEVTLSALHALVAHLGTLRDGRKSVLFVSKGPPVTFRDGDVNRRLDDVVDAANKGNVLIHVMDPQGLTGTLLAHDSLYVLANSTGGRAILNTNDLTRGLTNVMRDASAYYLLGYAPKRPLDDGKFHKITVRVTRKGLRVLARRGYFAPPAMAAAPAPLPEAAPDVRAAMGALSRPKGGRAVAFWIGQQRVADGRTTVRLSWAPARSSAVGASAPASVDIAVVDAREVTVAEAVLERSASSGPAGASATLTIDPGEYVLQATVRDVEGVTLDRWTEPLKVQVVAAGGLELSTPAVFVAQSSAQLREMTAGSAAPSPVREYRRTDRVVVRVDAWATDAQPRLEAELLNRRGTVLTALPLATPRAAAQYEVEVPVASLAQGEYVLRLVASQGETRKTELIAFRVVP